MQENDIKIVDVVSVGSLNDVEKLINAGYDVNESDDFGNTPIIIAASRNDLAMFEILKAAGGKVNVSNKDGQSALTWAKHHNNNEMVNLINSGHNSRLHPK